MGRSQPGGCVLWNADLGRYDFSTFTVLLGHHDDPSLIRVTARHEYLHHFLTANTSYGWLLQRVKREALDSGDPRYGRLLKVLADGCRAVQEMLATYDSLTVTGRRDLLPKLPDFYRQAFRRGVAVTDRVFDSTLLRVRFLQAIARLAMMTELGEAEDRLVQELLTGDRKELPPSHAPDKRFDRLERGLRSMRADTLAARFRPSGKEIEPYVTSESVDDLLKTLRGDYLTASSGLAGLSSWWMDDLSTLLDGALPGLSRNYGAYLMQRMARHIGEELAEGKGRNPIKQHSLYESVRESANETPAFRDGPLPRIEVVRKRRDELARLAENSLRKTGALYLYVERRPHWAWDSCFLTDVDYCPHQVLRCYQLTEAEARWLQTIPGPRVTIVEEETLRRQGKVRLPTHLSHAAEQHCFVHLAGNPIDHLTGLLAANRRVRWSYFGMGYRTGEILPHHQLQLVLYAVDGLHYTRFHLSHPLLTSPIMTFTDWVVANDTKLKYVPSGMLPSDFPVADLTWLSDHPILAQFHLIGRAARVLHGPT